MSSSSDHAAFIDAYRSALTMDGQLDPTIKVERLNGLVRYEGTSPSPYENGISFAATRERLALREAIVEQIDYFRKKGKAFEWKYSSLFSPEGTESLLVELGFTPSMPESILYVPSSSSIAGKGPLPFAIRELIGEADLAALSELQSAVWNEDFAWLARGLAREKLSAPEQLKIYGAFHERRLVSTGWIRFYKDVAMLHGGSTRLEARGKGAFSALVRTRVAAAHERACPFVAVEAVPESALILKRLGFREAGATRAYFWKPLI